MVATSTQKDPTPAEPTLSLNITLPLRDLTLDTMEVRSVEKATLVIDATAENLPLGRLVLRTQDSELIALARKEAEFTRKNPDSDQDLFLSMDRVEEGIRQGKFELSFPDLDTFLEK